jgi:hypothetical protein
MKITIERVQKGTIEEFAEKHDLTMEVIERDGAFQGTNRQFSASFYECGVVKGKMLHGLYGDGRTPEEAIKDYARVISEETLSINNYPKSRKEVKVWRLV